MSVQQAKQELEFLDEFHRHMTEMIRFADLWEVADAQNIAANGTSNIRAIPTIGAWKPEYEHARAEVAARMVQFKELSSRYGVTLSENVVFAIPTGGRSVMDYGYAFPEVAKEQILRAIHMVRGAADRHLREEQDKELEEKNRPPIPWRTKAWASFKKTLKLLHETGYLKPIVLVVLFVVVIVVLHRFGFDLKTILDIVKAIRP